jgi:hypothetical protein
VNRLDQETAKRRGPTRAVEPFKKNNNNNINCPCAELIKHYAMKAYGEWMYDPHFLDLGTSWR